MSDLYNILMRFRDFTSQFEEGILDSKRGYSKVAQQFIDLESEKPIEEQPELIGYLNTAQGFKGFKRSEVGTEVFSYKDKYFINIEPLNEGLTMRMSYYKETLRPVINFIETKE